MGFPRIHASVLASSAANCSDLLLQCSNWVRLDNCLSWTSLDFGLLPKHHPDARLGGWLGASLQAAEAWECEDAVLLDLLGGNSHQAVYDLGAHFLLQAMLSCKSLSHGTFVMALPPAFMDFIGGS